LLGACGRAYSLVVRAPDKASFTPRESELNRSRVKKKVRAFCADFGLEVVYNMYNKYSMKYSQKLVYIHICPVAFLSTRERHNSTLFVNSTRCQYFLRAYY
jgi:hypothetical protein